MKGGWSICEGRLESGPRVWTAGGCCEAGVMGTANEDGEENGLCVGASPEKRVAGEQKGMKSKRGAGAAAAKIGLAAAAPKNFR